jgi:hypothetical protein
VLEDGRIIRGQGINVPAITIKQDNATFSFGPSDYFPVKALQPIPMNGGVSGWFMADAKGVWPAERKGAVIKVSVKDYSGKPYTAGRPLSGDKKVIDIPTPLS